VIILSSKTKIYEHKTSGHKIIFLDGHVGEVRLLSGFYGVFLILCLLLFLTKTIDFQIQLNLTAFINVSHIILPKNKFI